MLVVLTQVFDLLLLQHSVTFFQSPQQFAAIFPGDEIDVDQVRCWLRQIVDAGICKLEKIDGQWWLLKGDGSFALNGLPKSKRAKQTEVIGSPVVKVFPCRGAIKEWSLTRADVEAWQAEFPGLDVMHCATCAYVYVMADVARQKTAKGMRRFLADWIMREANAQKRQPQAARFDKASRFEPSKAFAEFGAAVN